MDGPKFVSLKRFCARTGSVSPHRYAKMFPKPVMGRTPSRGRTRPRSSAHRRYFSGDIP
jgi:hypothetical protein